MAGQEGQPKYGFGWPDGRLGGLGPAGSTTPALITVIYFSDVTPSSDWDSHSPNFGFLTSFNNR